MKRVLFMVLLYSATICQFSYGQAASVDKVQFFADTSIINATITANTTKLFGHYKKGYTMPAVFTAKLPDGSDVNEHITLEIRGHFRHDYCYFPPLKLIFKENKSSPFYSLKSLKLVSQCKTQGNYDQYIYKEFLIYKLYNILTDMSFRVRMLNLELRDSTGKKKPITEHAFLMEDIKEVAKRNKCIALEKELFNTESTDRRQMTMVALFEYMIGNTDYGVSVNHNTKLISSNDDVVSKPFVVPYDFDYSGLVNTDYAVPDENLGIETVRDRLYRGFPRTMVELNEILDIFKAKKGQIYATINNFSLLNSPSRKDMIGYLDDFFRTIEDQRRIKSIFIEEARTK